MSYEHSLLDQYGDPLVLLTEQPQSVTDLYYRWAEVPPRKSLSRRERNERRWLATHLFKASQRREIRRVVATAEHGGEYIAFTTLDAAHAA